MTLFSCAPKSLTIAAVGALVSFAAAGSAFAQQCPDWQLNGIPVSTDAEQAWVPQRYSMYAGGAVDLGQCGSLPGVGYVTAAPNFSLQYDDLGMGRDLELRVESECDTTMLINDSTAEWHFNDDNDGLNAGMRLAGAPGGRYDIWVGTYGSTACQATLIAETFPPGNGAGAGAGGQGGMCPDWQLGGQEVRLTAGSNQSVNVQAGGALDMFTDQCAGVDAHGYIDQAPSVTLYYDAAGRSETLELHVQSQCDTLMLVNDQAANWHFNDDHNSLMPGIIIPTAPDGRYDIWVGTYSQPGCQASLSMSAGASAGGGASK